MKKLWNALREFYDDKYGTLIIVSWVALILCCIVKIFGGNLFELWWDNPNFIAFCEYVENTTLLKMTIACLIYLISGYFILCITLNIKKLSLKHILIFSPIMIFKSLISWYNTTIAFILDYVILLIIPIIITKKIKRPIIVVVLIMIFQLITIVMRNLSFDFNIGNTIIENYLIQVDYYLMILLFYLYNFKRNNKKIKEID